jgi:hypothetical protein
MLIYRRGMPVATGRIRDASRSGVFVETSYAELREHQSLEFEFRMPDCARERLRVAAHVRRCVNDGLALELDEADRDSLHAIGTLLDARAAPQPAYPGAGARVASIG